MRETANERIVYLFNCIRQEAAFDSFVLNKKVAEYLKEVDEIQKKCNHKFENHICIYCFKEEKSE